MNHSDLYSLQQKNVIKYNIVISNSFCTIEEYVILVFGNTGNTW